MRIELIVDTAEAEDGEDNYTYGQAMDDICELLRSGYIQVVNDRLIT